MLRGLSLQFVVGLLVVASAFPVDAEDETESRVFQNLADFIVNRDSVFHRYAFAAVGETWSEPPNKAPSVHPFCYMKVEDKTQNWDFYAKGMPLGNHSPFGQNEIWDQYLQHNGTHKIKTGTIRVDKTYVTKPKDIRLNDFKNKCGMHQIYFEPFDDILMVGTFFTFHEPNRNAAEKVFLSGASLRSATKGVQGTIESRWHWRWGDMDLDITMVQAAAYGNMPVRVEFTDRQPKFKNFFSETHIEWKKQNELWVPVRTNTATVVNAMLPEPTGIQVLAKIDWLVGDEVTDEMIDPNATDHRIPLMDAFDLQYDSIVNGVTVAGDPWERPEDLEIELAKESFEKR